MRILGKAGADEKTHDRAKVLHAAGTLAYLQGDYSAAHALLEKSLATRRQFGERKEIAHTLNNLGSLARQRGDFATSRTLHEESLAIRRALGDALGVTTTLNNLGLVAYYECDYPAARALFEECRATSRELGEQRVFAYALINLGLVRCEQDDHAAAWILFEEGLAITRELGDRNGIAFALEGRATVIATLGNPLRAARIWGAAEKLREEIGAPLPSNERPRHDRRVAAARASINDDAAFDLAWREGRASTLDQATELALETPIEQG
jgi:tetratricopeptide (TPR) repeat protein